MVLRGLGLKLLLWFKLSQVFSLHGQYTIPPLTRYSIIPTANVVHCMSVQICHIRLDAEINVQIISLFVMLSTCNLIIQTQFAIVGLAVSQKHGPEQ